MESLLIWIKHHFPFLWEIIEWMNGILFSMMYGSRTEKILKECFSELVLPPILFRKLYPSDDEALFNLIKSQKIADLEYFNPHGFDIISIKRQFNKPSFLMMGTFDGDKIVGYFFLRFFANRKCFVGRLIDKDYRGKGIGNVMNSIMYEIAWRLNFRCLSTISLNNIPVIRAHAKNPTMVIIKELQGNYLLVEFVRKDNGKDKIGKYL